MRVVYASVAADSSGDGGQVAFVRANDEVASAEGAFDDAGIDDVGGTGGSGKDAGGPGPGVIETFDFASGHQPGELRLARCASPALGNDGGGDGRRDAAEQQGTVAGPHWPLPRSAAISAPISQVTPSRGPPGAR